MEEEQEHEETISTEDVENPMADKSRSSDIVIVPTSLEAPYVKQPRLRPCLRSPKTLYHLAAAVVDQLEYPEAFEWTEQQVAEWMAEALSLPQYKECITDNMINGRRLLMMESPTHLACIGVRDLRHIKMITLAVRRLFGTEFIRHSRSIGLPRRVPLTHCTWFKSRTGPSWGIRQNWTRCDLLRATGIIMPIPPRLDHWDLVWYQKPEYPKVKFARVPKHCRPGYIPHYKEREDNCDEILVPRKFITDTRIPKENQMIWMQKIHYPPLFPEVEVKKIEKVYRVVPKPVKCDGLKGQKLLLTRRLMKKPKFLP